MSKFSDVKIGEKTTRTVKIIGEVYASQSFFVYTAKEDLEVYSVSGYFPMPLHLLKFYELTGVVEERKGSKQLKVQNYRRALPIDEVDIVEYLQSFNGLDLKAKHLYEAVGKDVLILLRDDPEKLYPECKNLGFNPATVLSWSNKMKQEDETDESIADLLSLGVTAKRAKELVDTNGSGIGHRIKKNPYLLLSLEIKASFEEVDKLARKLGIAEDNPYRVSEAIIYCLKEAGNEGDTLIETNELLSKVCSVLKTDSFESGEESIRRALEILAEGNRVIVGDGFVQLERLHRAERTILERIEGIMSQQYDFMSKEKVEYALNSLLGADGITLEKKQEEAVYKIASSRGGLFILTGPAGSGKTFLSRIICQTYKKLYGNTKISCLAPTGKAAKNISNAMSLPASTIHRFIGKMSYGYHSADSDIYIIDEFSMVDTLLGAMLFKNLPPSSKVIILGDSDQLPSIGPGALLRDLTARGDIPHIALDVVKRQTKDSGILTNADRVRNGEMIKTETPGSGAKDNFFFYEGVDAEQTILGFCEKRGLKAFQSDRSIILLPRRVGKGGTNEFNLKVQCAINPWDGTSLRVKSVDSAGVQPLFFHKGDKVMHTQNDYNAQWMFKKGPEYLQTGSAGIMNGEAGVIEDIVRVPIYGKGDVVRIIVKYGEEYIFYDGKQSDNLTLAYAISVHKSQGSQWKEVYSILTMNDIRLLDKKILYTLVSRAQVTEFVASSKEVIELALKNEKPNLRKTGLAVR